MIITHILIEYKNTSDIDKSTYPNDDKKIEFNHQAGWRTTGPIFPIDIKVMSFLSDILKDLWRTNK